jgi:hypothetical protein
VGDLPYGCLTLADGLRQLDVLGHVGAGQQRLGQPRPDVVLASPRHGPELVERLPGDDPDQVRARVADLGLVDAGPPEPGPLHDVLGVGRGAEHLVGNGEERAAVGDERVSAHGVETTGLVGVASGCSPHAAAYSSEWMPRATLARAARPTSRR